MIDIHADDYALSVKTSKDILELMQDGVFDSISIIPNNNCYDECMDLLKKRIEKLPFLPRMSVHINLVEGLNLSDCSRNFGWKELFFASCNPFRRNGIKEELKREISAQLKKGNSGIMECMDIARHTGVTCAQEHLRIDSHQHTHMIPVVKDALLECIKENNYEVEYIRNSKEPLIPFLQAGSLIPGYSLSNLIKNRVLWFFSRGWDKYELRINHTRMYLWGLVMSGKMDRDRLEKLYSSVVTNSVNNNRNLEILFHPGRMDLDELCDYIPIKTANDFYLSVNRDVEKDGSRKAKELMAGMAVGSNISGR